MSKTMKDNLINVMKHVRYDHESARFMNRRKVVEAADPDKYYKKYRKFQDYDE